MLVAACSVVAAGAVSAWLLVRSPGAGAPGPRPVRACDVALPVLERIYNGYVPGRSGDVLAAEQPEDAFGTRHSTPYYYTQHIPLVLYGPGFIRSGLRVERPVTMADVAPTLAELLHFDAFPRRDGSVLREALLPRSQRNGVPRLIFTLVWDGGGWDDLEQWPHAWPHLKHLMTRGVDSTDATDGSSPSITPSIHATLGTGAFPRHHGIADIKMRVHGRMVDAWQHGSPRYLRLETLADLWDLANGNRPLIGLEARDHWHLGMIGHGAAIPGADRDIAVLDALGRLRFTTNPRYYEMPPLRFNALGVLARAVRTVDRRDGALDGRWLGHPISGDDPKVRYTPAWSIYQTDRVIALLQRYGFGRDTMPDLFFTNYKTTDLAGHEWGMTTPEERQDLAEQDRQIPVLIDALDRIVGRNRYVPIITADHGLQPPPTATGGWHIDTRRLSADIERRFDRVTPHRPLLVADRGYAFFLDPAEMRRNHVTAADVARFIRHYRLADNAADPAVLPDRYENRKQELLYRLAVTPRGLRRARACARGRRPDAVGAQSWRSPDSRSATTRARNWGLPST